jgi:hypothetical protein
MPNQRHFQKKNTYEHIHILSEEIGPRVAGSENGFQAYIEKTIAIGCLSGLH